METLHAWAVAPAAIGTCCLAADRARVRPPEVVASALMLLAMLDASTGFVAPVYWAALLLAAAMSLALWRTPRRVRAARTPAAMTLHTALGMIAMAALQLAMAGHAGPSAPAGHLHGAMAFVPLVLAGAAGYAALSVLLARHMPSPLDRWQLAAMGASVALMALGLL